MGNGFEDREGNSYFNQIELEHVTNYVRLLLADGIVKEHEIGVISPYRAQVCCFKFLWFLKYNILIRFLFIIL